ncbi:MAG: alternate F1F0 ATPase, F1 subunit alpha [Methanotrichaceae archaeon]|nr:alternate F1F0 ATPase, F1 subunit alpha [Methanotrichaceae archaeon]
MANEAKVKDIRDVLKQAVSAADRSLYIRQPQLKFEEIGVISFVGSGIVRIKGLPHVKSEELIRFPGNLLGLAFNLDQEETAVVMLDKSSDIEAGQVVRRTGRILDVPVGAEILGRVVDALGRPIDEGESIYVRERRPIERRAPGIMDRSPVTVPLQTGIMVVDAMIPVGRGQRELILGDRQTGKTAIALDTIINQRDKDVICVYCSIGQEKSEVAKIVANLRKNEAIEYSIIVVASGEDPAGLNYVAPYSATAMAEYFMEKGNDVLIVYDDLTRHARYYRELALLLRRPPGREAFPGDIFYIHSRLLERATNLREGGSLSALPIIETQAQDISAYIPTNLISITDGQIYLSPELFRKGILPAVDVGQSVSRVGGKSQLPAYAEVAGDLRLIYSQFEDLEAYTRFGTRLDEETRRTLARGERIREVLKQAQYEPIPAPEQIAVLLAITEGLLDKVPLDEIASSKEKIRKAFREKLPDLYEQINSGQKLSPQDRESLVKILIGLLRK